MSFDKIASRRREFARWTSEHRDELLASGIPIVAWSKLEYWWSFLEEGFLPYDIDPSRFEVEQLTDDQARTLLRLLEAGETSAGWTVLHSLRSRQGDRQ